MYRILSLAVGLMAAVAVFLALLVNAGAVTMKYDKDDVVTALRSPQAPVAATEETIAFPVQLQGTSLIAEHLVSYEGPFIEDGTDDPVFDIAALMVCNTGQREIAEMTIVLYYGCQPMIFCGYNILPGMHVMLLEQNRSAFPKGDLTGYNCTYTEEAGESHTAVQIEQIGMGCLIITNTSGQTLDGLTLHHKLWQPADIYVGGITYLTRIGSLQPGESVRVTPSHYANGYSKIIKVSI